MWWKIQEQLRMGSSFNPTGTWAGREKSHGPIAQKIFLDSPPHMLMGHVLIWHLEFMDFQENFICPIPASYSTISSLYYTWYNSIIIEGSLNYANLKNKDPAFPQSYQPIIFVEQWLQDIYDIFCKLEIIFSDLHTKWSGSFFERD